MVSRKTAWTRSQKFWGALSSSDPGPRQNSQGPIRNESGEHYLGRTSSCPRLLQKARIWALWPSSAILEQGGNTFSHEDGILTLLGGRKAPPMQWKGTDAGEHDVGLLESRL